MSERPKSNKISHNVHNLLKYIAMVKGISLKEVAKLAVEHHKNTYSAEQLQKQDYPIQNPLVYPTFLNSMRLHLDDIKYVDSLTTHCRRNMPEGLDRVIVSYQNSLSDIDIPEFLRVNWLDEQFLNWLASCP